MQGEIFVSVIIPCYNHGAFLMEAVRSVQSTFETEIIIVNDGSTDDNTLQILQKLENEFQVIHQSNQGSSRARNAALAHAKGKFVVPLDADNILCPEMINRGVAFLESNPSVDVVYGDKVVFGEKQLFSKNRHFSALHLLYHHHIDTCAVIRKEILEKANGFSEEMPFNTLEDWDLWLRIYTIGGRFQYLPFTFFQYRHLRHSKLRTLNSKAHVRLEITRYFMGIKERALQYSFRRKEISFEEARQLRSRWKWALLFYACRAFAIPSVLTAAKLILQSDKISFQISQLYQLCRGKIFHPKTNLLP